MQDVAGDLLPDELVVGQVAVERLDHPVAVAPGVVADVVPLEALALAEPDDIQPVARPALAVMGRGEQPIDQLLVGLASPYRRRTARLRPARAAGRSGRRRAAGSSVRRSASGAGCRSRASSRARTNRSMLVAGPPRIAHGRRLGLADGLERPPVVARAAVGRREERVDLRRPPLRHRRRSSASAAASRRRSAAGDPGASRRNRRSPAAGSRPACPAR